MEHPAFTEQRVEAGDLADDWNLQATRAGREFELSPVVEERRQHDHIGSHRAHIAEHPWVWRELGVEPRGHALNVHDQMDESPEPDPDAFALGVAQGELMVIRHRPRSRTRHVARGPERSAPEPSPDGRSPQALVFSAYHVVPTINQHIDQPARLPVASVDRIGVGEQNVHCATRNNHWSSWGSAFHQRLSRSSPNSETSSLGSYRRSCGFGSNPCGTAIHTYPGRFSTRRTSLTARRGS